MRCVWNAGTVLGEGPLWSDAEQTLYWVDIKRAQVLRYRPADERREVFQLPAEVGCIGLVRGGGLVAALRTGFALLDLEAGHVEPLVDPEHDRPGNRFNDGKVGPGGRFWAGTMDDGEAEPTGCLYRLDPDLSVTRADEGYVITNGPTFSPDGRLLYHVDSLARRVDAFEHDPSTGTLGERRPFIQLEERDGYPDGLTVDEDGGVWLAQWGGWCVTRYAPDGRRDRHVELPVSQVTSCTFGGDHLATLYVTSASKGLDAAARAAEPLAGGLFAVEVGARGLPALEFTPSTEPRA